MTSSCRLATKRSVKAVMLVVGFCVFFRLALKVVLFTNLEVFLDSYATKWPYIIAPTLWSCNCAKYESCQIVCCMFKLHYEPQKTRNGHKHSWCTNTKSGAQKAMSIFYSNWPNIQKPRAAPRGEGGGKGKAGRQIQL